MIKFLLLAAWFGLLTGFAEVGILAQQKLYPFPYQKGMESFLLLSRHVVWMTPVADLLLFAIPGVIFCFLAWRWPRIASLRIATGTFGFLGFLSLLCMSIAPRLQLISKLLLATGLAVQTSYFIARHASGFQSFVRRTLPWMGVAVLVQALVVHGWEYRRENQALSKLAPVVANRPNVLLIIMDTVRAQSLSLYGNPRTTTPQLERLAETSVVFDRAFSTAPWTLPSIASIFTGRFPHELSADWWRPLNNVHPTLAEVLRNYGYETAGFVANTVFCSDEFGLDRGFVHYEVYLKSLGQIFLSSSLVRFFGCWFGRGWGCELRPVVGYYEALGRKTAKRLNRDFLEWLSVRDRRRPFFAFLNYFDAHHPYLPPKPFDTMFASDTPRKNPAKSRRDVSIHEARVELNAYEATIANLDHYIGLLFVQLKEQKLLENTLVIITSDHGESFLEHGVMHHGNSLYTPQLRVPLLISFPGRLPAGKRILETVTLRDIPATVLDLTNLGGRSSIPGRSLSRYWVDGRNTQKFAEDMVLSETSGMAWEPPRYPVSKGDMQSLVIGSYHYIRTGDGKEELYNLEEDPWEKTNLAPKGARKLLNRFRALLGRTQVDLNDKS